MKTTLLAKRTSYTPYHEKAVLPELKATLERKASHEILERRLIEDFSFLYQNKKLIEYGEKGRLSKVIYVDDSGKETVSTYSYDFDGEKLTDITISTEEGARIKISNQENGQTKISITLAQSEGDQSDDNGNIIDNNANHYNAYTNSNEHSNNGSAAIMTVIRSLGWDMADSDANDSKDDPKPSPGPDNPVGPGPDDPENPDGDIVIIIDEPVDLEGIAHEPIDFEKFLDAFRDVDEDLRKARDEYMEETEPYYEKMLEELTAKVDSLESEGIDLKPYFSRGLGSNDTKEGIKRSLINEAVAEIAEAAKQEDVKPVAEDLISLEERYSEEFLRLSMDNYENKTEKILEYIQGIIDELLTSKLAIYMNKKKEKIDVIINLPELEEENI